MAATGLLALVGLGLWAGGLIHGDPLVVAAMALATAFWNGLVLLRLHTYQANQKPASFFWMSAAPPLSAFILTLALAAIVDDWASRLIALLATAVLAGGWAALSLRAESRMSLSLGRQRLGEVFRFGAPLIVYTASIWIIGFTDRFIVAERLGLADAGVYTVAYSLALGVSSLHDGVARFFVSRLPNWVETDEGQVTASRFAFRYSVIALLTIPLLIPLAFLGLNLLAAEAFADGSELLIWLIPAQAFGGIARLFTGYLYVERRTRARALLGAGEATLNVVLTWILVGIYGLVGAAIATLVTYAVSMVGTFLLARNGTSLMPLRAIRRSS
jgi:O-antigen/teichoic acid export membrane protein